MCVCVHANHGSRSFLSADAATPRDFGARIRRRRGASRTAPSVLFRPLNRKTVFPRFAQSDPRVCRQRSPSLSSFIFRYYFSSPRFLRRRRFPSDYRYPSSRSANSDARIHLCNGFCPTFMYPWYPRDTAEVQVCADGPQSSGGSPASAATAATSPAIKSENGSTYGDCMDYALHAKVSVAFLFVRIVIICMEVCSCHQWRAQNFRTAGELFFERPHGRRVLSNLLYEGTKIINNK